MSRGSTRRIIAARTYRIRSGQSAEQNGHSSASQVDQVLLERRLRPRVVAAVRRNPRVDRLEILDDIVHGRLPQPEALAVETLRDVEVVRYEPRNLQRPDMSSTSCRRFPSGS
jgi:hypothetical protein